MCGWRCKECVARVTQDKWPASAGTGAELQNCRASLPGPNDEYGAAAITYAAAALSSEVPVALVTARTHKRDTDMALVGSVS